MPVDSKRKEYEKFFDRWDKVRTAVDGETAVKEAGMRYLKKLSAQSFESYDAYKDRAQFYEASGRTLAGLVGAIFRKDPEISLTGKVEYLKETATKSGVPLINFSKSVTNEVLALGRYGVLVDVAVDSNAYLAGYPAESIINWRTQTINGSPTLTLVVLKEAVSDPSSDDVFSTETVPQLRVLFLDATFKYAQEIWQKRKNASKTAEEWMKIGETIFPSRRGERLDYIPFTFIGPETLSETPEVPPLEGLVNVNLSHYRTSADLEHGAHFTALPTPVIIGDIVGNEDDEGEVEFAIGSGTAWHLRGDGADAKMLEYTGQGLGALEARLERKEAHMAVLGARLLEDQKAGIEAAQTVAMRHAGENSLLASIADTVSRGLTRALVWASEWMGASDEAFINLNKDFFEQKMSADDVLKLTSTWMSGGIGGEVLYHNLSEGERLPNEMTLEEWQADLEANGPTMPGLFDSEINDEDQV